MTDDDAQGIANSLASLAPGFLPLPIFLQIARLIALPIIELVPLRMNDDAVEVLLLERPKSDEIFKGALHTPGTVIRATDFLEDDSFQSAFERIKYDELAAMAMPDPTFVKTTFHKSIRGAELAQVYFIECLDAPMVGAFYPVSALPSEFMESQRGFVMAAAKMFAELHG